MKECTVLVEETAVLDIRRQRIDDRRIGIQPGSQFLRILGRLDTVFFFRLVKNTLLRSSIADDRKKACADQHHQYDHDRHLYTESSHTPNTGICPSSQIPFHLYLAYPLIRLYDTRQILLV